MHSRFGRHGSNEDQFLVSKVSFDNRLAKVSSIKFTNSNDKKYDDQDYKYQSKMNLSNQIRDMQRGFTGSSLP